MTSKPPFIAQERSDTCMLACLRMLLAFQGTVVAETALVNAVDLREHGVNPDELAKLAQRYGLNAEAQQLNLGGMVALVREGRFPIVLVDRTFLDDEFTVHAVIPIRFSARFVTVLDPLRGERRVSVRKFEQAQRRVGGWSVVWNCD